MTTLALFHRLQEQILVSQASYLGSSFCCQTLTLSRHLRAPEALLIEMNEMNAYTNTLTGRKMVGQGR